MPSQRLSMISSEFLSCSARRDRMLVKYMEKVDASMVVICCSSLHFLGSLKLWKFHMPFHSIRMRTGLYLVSKLIIFEGVKSERSSMTSTTVLDCSRSPFPYSTSPSSQRMTRVLPAVWK